jgi:hypothetical protein
MLSIFILINGLNDWNKKRASADNQTAAFSPLTGQLIEFI